ncbi:MAG TPA: CsbD family protein [Opitutus sp.]|nr:CsbD family protein [Opitutus sp.]
MNSLIIKGTWNEAKGRLKQRYANLLDDDLVYVEGREDEVLGRIQRRTGAARDEIEKILRDEST